MEQKQMCSGTIFKLHILKKHFNRGGIKVILLTFVSNWNSNLGLLSPWLVCFQHTTAVLSFLNNDLSKIFI